MWTRIIGAHSLARPDPGADTNLVGRTTPGLLPACCLMVHPCHTQSPHQIVKGKADTVVPALSTRLSPGGLVKSRTQATSQNLHRAHAAWTAPLPMVDGAGELELRSCHFVQGQSALLHELSRRQALKAAAPESQYIYKLGCTLGWQPVFLVVLSYITNTDVEHFVCFECHVDMRTCKLIIPKS
jgi:hypothetical protein